MLGKTPLNGGTNITGFFTNKLVQGVDERNVCTEFENNL